MQPWLVLEQERWSDTVFGPNPVVCAVMHLRQGLILGHMTVNRTGMVNMFTGGGTEIKAFMFQLIQVWKLVSMNGYLMFYLD